MNRVSKHARDLRTGEIFIARRFGVAAYRVTIDPSRTPLGSYLVFAIGDGCRESAALTFGGGEVVEVIA